MDLLSSSVGEASSDERGIDRTTVAPDAGTGSAEGFRSLDVRRAPNRISFCTQVRFDFGIILAIRAPMSTI